MSGADPLELQLDVQPGLLLPETGAASDGSKFLYQRNDLRLQSLDRVHFEATIDDTQGALEACVQLALQVALLPRGGLMVHASTGVHRGEAWLMPGPSGTGKSTAARNAGFEGVLCDAMSIIRRQGPGYVAYGTPFWSEGRSHPLRAEQAPLGVLARLRQSSRAALGPLPRDEAASWLMTSVALYEVSDEASSAALELACEVAERCRCVRLDFPREGPWLSALETQ